MSTKLSRRLQQLPPSATLAMNARVQALRTQGRSVLNFSVGEPDFPTPERICAAAERALHAGHTRYTEERGILPLREAICARLHQDYGVAWTPDEVTVTNGGKQALYNLFMALLDPGDEVIIPAPYWLSYPPQVVLAQGVPVLVPTHAHEGFQLDPERLEKAITPRTRAIILNHPSNPTGMGLDRRVLEAVAALALRHDLLIVSDDLYYRLAYDGYRFQSVAALAPELKARTVVVGGMSKAYAMTGWRVGFALGPQAVIKAMSNLQGQTTSNACTVSQHAAVEALRGSAGDAEILQMVAAFAARRSRMVELLRQIPGVQCLKPDGAFYTFPQLDAFYGRRTPAGQPLTNSLELASWLVEEVGVAAVPGSVFGDDRHLRFSYACDLATLEEGMQRLGHALGRLQA